MAGEGRPDARLGRTRARALLAAVTALVLLGGCRRPEPPRAIPPAAPTVVPAAQGPQSEAARAMEQAVWERINAVRRSRKLEPLKVNERLARVARAYSRQMATRRFFSHEGADGTWPADRARAGGVPYELLGENLFMSGNMREPVPAAVKGWMESKGHRGNILQPGYTETGIGVWCEGDACYFTQEFLRPPGGRG